MTNEQHIQFNNKLKELLKRVVEKFENHGIEWFACGGTALGAIRHKDIIPWDDDVDLFIPRKSYEKLLSLKQDFIKDGLNIASINDKGYNHSYAKILDTSTTIWENKIYPVSGLWIDIFPLDYYDKGVVGYLNDMAIHTKTYRKYQRGQINYRLRNFLKPLISLDLKRFFNLIASSTFYKWRSDFYRKKYLKLEQGRILENGANMVSYAEGGIYVYNSEWFNSYDELPFADFKIKLPIGWHEYLTMVYGDYMTPPPENKRKYTHSMLYINTREGLDAKTVELRLKQGESVVV